MGLLVMLFEIIPQTNRSPINSKIINIIGHFVLLLINLWPYHTNTSLVVGVTQ